MSKQDELFAEQAPDLLHPVSYLLSSLDLYQWGPFAGRHHVDIDPQGSAIVGATGSGKTTLVDALMTLICERPKYNLASTGGHESDRDLVSYVRGKAGEGNNIDDSHIARPGKTLSAIAAKFSNGQQRLLIAGIFWFEGSSSSQSDLKKLWLFNQSEQQDFDNLLEIQHQEGSKALKRLAKSTPHLSITESKKSYLAQLRRFFDVGDNAFTLLNRAAGLKQLNSIDEVFREWVLDDNTFFERATEVVKGFDTLSTIHEELVLARKQRDSLMPIKQEAAKHAQLNEQRGVENQLLDLLPIWYAEQRFQLLQSLAQNVQSRMQALNEEITLIQQQHALSEQQAEALHTAYIAAGGGDEQELQRSLSRLRDDWAKVNQSAQQYQQLVRQWDLPDTLDVQTFNRNKAALVEQHNSQQQQLAELNEPLRSAITQVQKLREQQRENQAEFQLVTTRPSSNIPPKQAEFRQLLADQLSIYADNLPYLAELVEVKAEQSAWRGAIERALSAHRLRILVPQTHMQAALRWVNSRDNRLDVRLLEVQQAKETARFMDDGYVRKLNFKPHPHREAAKVLLAGIDRHCVDSSEALRGTAYGMTCEGMMSGKKGYFEKRDKTSLNQNWMTGFDNRDRLAQLKQAIQTVENQLKQAQAEEKAADQAVQGIKSALKQLDLLAELSFADINGQSVQDEITQYEQRIANLRDPKSDTEKARQRWEQAKQQSVACHHQLTQKTVEHQSSENQLNNIEQKKQRTFQQVGDGLDDTQREFIQQHHTVPDAQDDEALLDSEKQHIKAIHDKLAKLNHNINRSEKELVRQMAKAKQQDTGALADAGSELRDIPEYLARLDVLVNEALPEKENDFLQYLRSSSDQSVTQLLSSVDNEVESIEERIEDLNATMQQVDFELGRYLRLDPQRVVHESIRTLKRQQRQLNSARLKEDKGESHYQALQQVIALVRDAAENRRKVGARALLDPRYRLQFKASVIERQDHKVVNSFSGSQGGSGGEKEIIASYILTASLSYALCPQGARSPLFGTILLDEAFSRTSQMVAGRIVSALRQFNLHPLFVTPNKEMQLLRMHTRSAVLVHRKGKQATTTSMSWQELRDKALSVKQAREQL